MTRVEKQLKIGQRLAQIELEIRVRTMTFTEKRKEHKREVERLTHEQFQLCEAIRTGQGDLFEDATD